jgi:hypothetical protein
MEEAAKPQPGRNFPIKWPQFLGENTFVEKIADNAVHIASPNRESAWTSRQHRYGRLSKVKGMARCAALLMGLSLIAGCAAQNPSPTETLEQQVERALPPELGKPEYVEKMRWYVSGIAWRFPDCDGAIAIFRDRFVMLHGKGPRQAFGSSCVYGFEQVTPEFMRLWGSPPISYKDTHPAFQTRRSDAFGTNNRLVLRVPFGPSLSPPNGPAGPKFIIMELAPNSQFPRILEQRRTQ